MAYHLWMGTKEVLARLLAENGLTQSEFAKRAKLTQATVNRLCSGEISNPTIQTLLPIAKYFGISVDELIGNKGIAGYDPATAIQLPPPSTPKMAHLLRTISDLDRQGRMTDRVVSILEQMAEALNQPHK